MLKNKIKYPFHYEIHFKVFKIANDKLIIKKFKKIINSNNNPLINRKEAFDLFDDYLNFLKENNRVKQNELGNYTIIQPSNISEKIVEIINNSKNNETKDIFQIDLSNLQKNQIFDNNFKEEINLLLVIDDPEIAKIIHEKQFGKPNEYFPANKEFIIHTVSSSEIEEQDIIDNLQMIEIELYEYFNIKINHLKKNVYHYGLDYSESGEILEGAKRVILPTPMKWQTKELYEKLTNEIIENKSIDKKNISNNDFLLNEIKKGETKYTEFKPAILYNFKTNKAGISIKYIIAKTICSFLNTENGMIFIGVKDNGEIQGLEKSDFLLFENNKKDKIRLELDNLISKFIGKEQSPQIDTEFIEINSKTIFVIIVSKSKEPVFLKNKIGNEIKKEFYIRMNASTQQIKDIEEILKYINNKKSR